MRIPACRPRSKRLTPPVPLLLLLLLAAACKDPPPGGSNSPAAVTPAIDSVRYHQAGGATGPKWVVTRTPCVGGSRTRGSFPMIAGGPVFGDTVTVWFSNVPGPAAIDVAVNDSVLTWVGASQALGPWQYQLDWDQGTNTHTLRFNPGLPVPVPNNPPHYMLRIRNKSFNQNLTGTSRISVPAEIHSGTCPANTTFPSGSWPIVQFDARNFPVPGGRVVYRHEAGGQAQILGAQFDETWGGADLDTLATAGATDLLDFDAQLLHSGITAVTHPVAGTGGQKDIRYKVYFGPSRVLAAAPQNETDPSMDRGAATAYVLGRDVHINGSNITNSQAVDTMPTLCPDGSRLAYISDGRLAALPLSGTAPQLTPPTGSADSSPVFSPDCSRIAFVRAGRLHVAGWLGVVADLGSAGSVDSAPAWNRDGTMIAFESGPSSAQRDIYVVNVPGGASTRARLTTSGESRSPTFGPFADRLLFVSNRDGDDDIFVINTTGTGLAPWTFNNEPDSHPIWR